MSIRTGKGTFVMSSEVETSREFDRVLRREISRLRLEKRLRDEL
jgi:hypothetical protein